MPKMKSVSCLVLLGTCVFASHDLDSGVWQHRLASISRVKSGANLHAAWTSPSTGNALVFSPAQFGGDPTGKADSLDAVNKAIAAMTEGCTPAGLQSTGPPQVCDLHSATLDLSGGTWSISNTVQFPSGYGNYNIQGGTLAAMSHFPSGAAVLNVGNESDAKGSSAKNINIQRLTIDGNYGLAGTGLNVWNGQYVNVGPAMMVYGFSYYGIRMTGTGGGYIHNSWLGEEPPYGPLPGSVTLDPAPRAAGSGANLTATCISLEGDEHDCYVQDVIIWSGRIGIRSQNGANKIQGVHTWNLQTLEGGIGIWLEQGTASVKDSYLDFCPLVITDPKTVVASGNLFLARGNLVLQANKTTAVENLVVTNNRWFSENKPEYKNATIVLDGTFTEVSGVTIESSSIDKVWDAKSTRATITAPFPSLQLQLNIDFSDALLFPQVGIKEVQCQLVMGQPIEYVVAPLPKTPQEAAEMGVGLHEVTVLLSRELDSAGEVTCTVDQSTRIHAAH